MIARLRRCWSCTARHVWANRDAYSTGSVAVLLVLTAEAYASAGLGPDLPGYVGSSVLIIAKAKILRAL